MEKSGWLDY